MKFLKFGFSLIALIAWIYFLNKPISTSKTTIPSIGPFMSPFTGFWHNGTMEDVPQSQIKSAALTEGGSIAWDTRLVPHVFAKNDRDLMYMAGYTVASQRLWQMDMLARSAAGRLSEVLGTRLLDRDKTQRRLGMLFAAENAIKGWQHDTIYFNLIQSYCRGVNDWISQLDPKNLPIEYKLMGFTPEPWTPLKSACVIKYMAQSLCSRESDLEATNTRQLLGDSLYNMMYPEYFAEQSPIIPAGTKWNFNADSIKKALVSQSEFPFIQDMYHRVNELPDPGLGSNNWAVNARKTKAGHPILCNDPHLRLTLPSIWFEQHLHTPDLNAYGVSVPGIPGILIGFNDSIAWGETNVGHDVADWYAIKWTDQKQNAYVVDGKTIPVNLRIEEINVKGQNPIFDTVKYTEWGPVVESDQSKNAHKGLAYHWLSHESQPQFELSVFLNMLKAKNYNDYYNALKPFSNPAQNVVFASHTDDIALTVTGKFPIKQKGQGRFIQDGSSSQNAWHGFIPYEQIPRVKNPGRGFVSSCNQNSTDPSYPYYYNGEFDNYRGRTLNELLSKKNDLTIEDMMSYQNNNFGLKAKENLPILLKLLDSASLTDNEKIIVDKLSKWDYYFNAHSQEAIWYTVWYRKFVRNTLDELYLSKDSSNFQYPGGASMHHLLADQQKNKIFDLQATPQTETAKDIVNIAFKAMIVDYTSQNNPSLTWAQYVKPRIGHLANLNGFSRENLNAGGDASILNATTNGHGPSWRMIIELADKINAHVVYPGGQSGNPASRHYDDMVDDWVSGKYEVPQFANNLGEIHYILLQNFSK